MDKLVKDFRNNVLVFAKQGFWRSFSLGEMCSKVGFAGHVPRFDKSGNLVTWFECPFDMRHELLGSAFVT